MEIVDVFKEKVNLIFGVTAGILAAIFGDWWWTLAAFMLFNVVDYITGWAKARYTGTEDSAKGAHGIWKKVCYWIIIAIAFFISVCFTKLGDMVNIDLGITQFIGWFTLASYGINEIRSILENIVVLQGDKNIVPVFVIKGLDIAQKFLKDKEDEQEERK